VTNGTIKSVYSTGNIANGVFFDGSTYCGGNTFQWSINNVSSLFNDRFGFQALASTSCAGSNSGTFSPWIQPTSFANTAGGIDLEGNSTNALSDFNMTGAALGADGNNEITLNTFAANISIVGNMLENAGRFTTGSSNSTPASHVGNGISVSNNNLDVVLSGNVIQLMSGNGIGDAGQGTVVSGNRMSGNGVWSPVGAGYVNAPGTNVISVVTGDTITSNPFGIYLNVPNAACTSNNNLHGNGTDFTGSWRTCSH